ncbi:hypothetical protein J6590_035914 [Homalodisca vitripennis]|nr:hypothetical protein J6590_089808 [Homalodisca vitripennis]KAG8311830.1 hypothetical protein J6590_035914 [Homalodisca vitripennis]
MALAGGASPFPLIRFECADQPFQVSPEELMTTVAPVSFTISVAPSHVMISSLGHDRASSLLTLLYYHSSISKFCRNTLLSTRLQLYLVTVKGRSLAAPVQWRLQRESLSTFDEVLYRDIVRPNARLLHYD